MKKAPWGYFEIKEFATNTSCVAARAVIKILLSNLTVLFGDLETRNSKSIF
jgi:hypothetical protein